MSHSTLWSILWVCHPSSIEFIHSSSQSYSKRITDILVLIVMYNNSSSTGTPTSVTTYIDLYGSQGPYILPVLLCLVGPPINFTGGRFTTGTDLSVFIFFFLNRTTGRWSALYFTITECATRTLLLMHYQHHCTYMILWLCCIVTAYHTSLHHF